MSASAGYLGTAQDGGKVSRLGVRKMIAIGD
jgi:hypothetical protein